MCASENTTECPWRSVRSDVLRFGLYNVALVAWTFLVVELGRWHKIGLFREDGFIEWMEVVLPLAAASVLLVAGWRLRAFRPVLWTMASPALIAVARELDMVLEGRIPLGWKLPAFVVAAATGAWMWRQRRVLVGQFVAWFKTPAFLMLYFGLILVVLIAQEAGAARFWQSIMGAGYQRDVKRIVEEIIESFGYFFLVLGAIEAAVQAHLATHHAKEGGRPGGMLATGT